MKGPDRRYDMHDSLAWKEVAAEFGCPPFQLKGYKEIVERMADEINRLRGELLRYADITERDGKDYSDAKQEITRLHRIIAKELTENDELGAEYTYVLTLKDENARLREALDFYSEPILIGAWRGDKKIFEFESRESCRIATEALALTKPGENK